MSTSDLFTADYPHGTVKGYDGLDGNEGCRGGACPGGDLWGLTCKHAKQLSRSDYQYQKLAAQGLGPAEIADKLGLIPTGATAEPVTKRAPKPKPADHATDAEPTVYISQEAWDATARAAAKIIAERDAEVASMAPATPKEIRARARDRGYEVKPMGKIPQHVLDHYWETHDLGAAPVDTNSAPVDTEAPETATIVPEPAGPRPEWGYVALTEDLARAQTDRDALAEELEEANDQLTRARGLAARLEEELARASEEHAAEISALHVQLADNHNGDRQRIEQLEESLANAEQDERIRAWELVASHPAFADCYAEDTPLLTSILNRLERLSNSVHELQTKNVELAIALAEANNGRLQLVAMLDRGIASQKITNKALEFTIRQWALERDRNQRHDEKLEAFRQEYETSRLGNPVVLEPMTISKLAEKLTAAPATPNDDGIPSVGLAARIRRGWAATR